ncbi:MAG TPA: ATP-binding protein [Anaerolineales bacterium]|nr:ATP-binding protein [Anaerolineales bacterium]
MPSVQLSAKWIRLIRLAWLTYALLVLALMLAGLPLVFNQMQTVCKGLECLWGQPSITGLQMLATSGLSLTTYAAYNTLLPLVVPILSLVLVTIVVWRKPNDRMALLFALVMGTCPVNLSNAPMALANTYPDFWLFAKVIEFGAAGFLPFFYLFPNGQFIPRWSRWLILPNFLIVGLVVFLPASQIPGTPAATLTGAWVVIAAVSTFLFQGYRYRYVANPVQRQQIKWLAYGLAMTSSTSILSSVLARVLAIDVQPGSLGFLISNTLATAAIAFFGISLWVAVLRYRLFDIDLLINRTLVYGVLTAGVVGVYVTIVAGLGAMFQSQGKLLASLLATSLIAMLFQPARSRLQSAVNRLMYGERDDPYAVLSRFGQRLEATLAPDSILPTIVETITQTLKLPYAAMRLSNETMIAHGALPPNTKPESFPLVYQGETIGQLEVAPRAADESFTPAERRLLTDIAHQAGIAAHAVRLTADLQHARERLVTTREEERRRLRRDLHDGLGPKLAGQALILEAVRDSLEPDSQSRPLVDHLITDSQSVVSEIRELVQGLRPPALDEFGLVGAVRSLAAQCEPGKLRVTVTAPDPMPPLPAAVEVSAYRIAQEALTNVVKHAQAKDCQVRLAFGDSTLRLEVQDNGLGLPAPRRPGVGLSSMRERAEEIGGSCVVEAGIDGGTSVTAQLPITDYQ